MRYFLLLIPFLVVAGCSSSDQDIQLTPDFAEYSVAAALIWNDAWAAGDAETIANQYTVDGMLLPPAGEPIVGRAAILEYWTPAIAALPGGGITSVESGSNGDLAFERGTYTLETADGEAVDHGKFVVVWKLVDGSWKMHRDIWNSSVPAEAEAPAAE